jgi:serine protease Do
MYKKRLSIFAVSVSFVLLLTLVLFLNIGPDRMASGQTSSSTEIKGLQSLSAAFVEVSKTVKPSVVNISTTSVVKRPRVESRRDPFWDPFRDFFGDDFFREFFRGPRSQRRTSLGSGVIVDEDGYILTNNHMVTGAGEAAADKIKVTLSDKREFDAKLVGRDPDTDVAVIKIDANGLPAARLGDSDELQVGEWVLAIGNPLGLTHTVTAGIISATGRSNMGLAEYEDFIQTDASINRGNSGGPLVNIKGEVIGINTAIATTGVPGNIGIGFSIPINMARNVMDQLIEKGKVVRGWLGILLQSVDSDIAEKYGLEEPRGALIASAGGPAKKAGLEPGDLIIEFNGEPVADGSHLQKLVAAAKPGETVKIKVIRDDKEREFKVKLGERTEEAVAELTGEEIPIPSKGEEWMGITVQELTDELAQRLGYEGQSGVLISDIDPDGPAAKAESSPKPGDLIQEIERHEIKDMDDYRQAIEEVKDQKSVLVRLRRATGGPWYVVLKKE